MANRVNLGRVVGETGRQGEQGLQGIHGADGLTPYISNGTWWLGNTNTGVTAKGNEWLYGSEAPSIQGVNGDLYINTSTSDVYKKINGAWQFLINIKGQQGLQGERGATAISVTIGNVITGSPESQASVINVGDDKDLVLDFVIPRGIQGLQGERGKSGGTSISINGFVQDNLNFDSDPQRQINEKLSSNFGEENAGKYLQVSEDGSVITSEVSGGGVNSFTINSLNELGDLFGINISAVEDEYIVNTSTIIYRNKEYNLANGDTFYIVDNNVPDYWFSLDNMKLYKIETKIEPITDYVSYEQVQELNEVQKQLARDNIGVEDYVNQQIQQHIINVLNTEV